MFMPRTETVEQQSINVFLFSSNLRVTVDVNVMLHRVVLKQQQQTQSNQNYNLLGGEH